MEAGALGDQELLESAAPRSVRDGDALALCPYLRLEAGAQLGPPLESPADEHRCVAIAGPRVVSRQQQELVCLRAAHVDCPRYRRAPASRSARQPFRPPAIPRAVAASLIILALSAGISFGFVMQRGGIDLPPTLAGSTAAAAVTSSSPSPSPATATRTPLAPSASPTPAVETASTAPVTPSSVPPPPSPSPSLAPATPPPSPSPAASVPSADRLAVISPCPGQAGCWIYHVRLGDNLWSIAHWFGIPLDTVYAWNPTVKGAGIHPGDALKIPTPTR